MNSPLSAPFAAVAIALSIQPAALAAGPESASSDLWQLANHQAKIHRYSTLFTAQDVRQHLSKEEGLSSAIDWCKQTGVTHVYVESFRDNYQAEHEALLKAKARFLAEGFRVSGCVTTTKVGKASTGWKEVACCYTDSSTQERLKAIFEYAAGLFDEIMIDDFWFTDCSCSDCDAARQAKMVTIGGHRYPVVGDTWEDYRCELMVRLSRDYVLAPAKAVNPNARLIIKYPQWYDNFHVRGYEVVRETEDFDAIWIGTETRNYTDKRWGGTPQYEAYFIMRWLGGIGGPKCGGGWFDPYGTTESTYLEQARQTILGGARESLLFCYGSLLQDTGPRNVETLRANLPELLTVAKEVQSRRIVGLAAYKPPNSHPEKEPRVFDFVGMLGLPLVPCHQFPASAPAGFFSVHALKDPQLVTELEKFIEAGKPVLLTDGLAQNLTNWMKLDKPNVRILQVNQDPKSLLQLGEEQVNALREPFLRPLKTVFNAPNRVALYLFEDKSWVVENFNDEAVTVQLNGKPMVVAARGWTYQWK